MLAASALCFSVTVIAGILIGICALRKRRPARVLQPLHIISAFVGMVFLLIALGRGDHRLILNVALGVVVASFGILMGWSRRRGYVIAPLIACHVLLAGLFYLSLAFFAIFPKF